MKWMLKFWISNSTFGKQRILLFSRTQYIFKRDSWGESHILWRVSGLISIEDFYHIYHVIQWLKVFCKFLLINEKSRPKLSPPSLIWPSRKFEGFGSCKLGPHKQKKIQILGTILICKFSKFKTNTQLESYPPTMFGVLKNDAWFWWWL